MSSYIQHTRSTSVSSDNSSTLKGSVSDSGSTEVALSAPLAAGSSNVAYAISFNGSNLQSIVLLASQNLTVLVNSTSTPALTIALVAGVPYSWSRSAGYFANPFNGITVTTFYLSCTPAATLRGKVLTS